MSFDEAKQKILAKEFWYPLGDKKDTHIKVVKTEDVLAVLSDLHHAWCAEAQKTLDKVIEGLESAPENSEKFYLSTRIAYSAGFYGCKRLAKEKAEKLLGAQAK